MGNFIFTVMGVAVVIGVTGMLTPDGETKKYVRLVGALCLLCALVSPILGAISSGGDRFEMLFPSIDTDRSEYEEIYKEAIVQGAKENAEIELTAAILSRFDLPTGSLELTMTILPQGDIYSVTDVQVVLMSSAIYADPREISEYINAELGCPCSVIYG